MKWLWRQWLTIAPTPAHLCEPESHAGAMGPHRCARPWLHRGKHRCRCGIGW